MDSKTLRPDLCACGCGEEAPVIACSHAARGYVKGERHRFVVGHNQRGRFDMRDLWERVLLKCEPEGDCLVWKGGRQADGYGTIGVRGRKMLVHRVVYEYFYGPIPDELQLDHVKARGCKSRACCNPLHLEAVTCQINVLRGNGLAAKNALKTHCSSGHLLSPDNIVRSHFVLAGKRKCLICAKAYSKRCKAVA